MILITFIPKLSLNRCVHHLMPHFQLAAMEYSNFPSASGRKGRTLELNINSDKKKKKTTLVLIYCT